MKQVSALFFCLMMMTMSLTGCLGDDSDSESSTDVDELPLTMYSVSDSVEGNVSEVWFTVNSTVEQALKIESLYISYCSPTDDDGDDPNTSEEEEYPYACDFSRTSLEVNSTCNGASIKLVANASIWLPSGDCIHQFGELGPFDEGYKHLAPYRNATWNMMYTIHPVVTE